MLGKPLSCICQGAAIFTLTMGAFRTWRSQNAIVRGKAITGGFEIVMLAAGMFMVSSESSSFATVLSNTYFNPRSFCYYLSS